MKCKNCPNDLGYKASMIWPSYISTCKINKEPIISQKEELYNKKCKHFVDNYLKEKRKD